MSLKVTTRVWQHARQRGTVKLLLLALADFANDDGVCWPGAARLAERINETERYTRLLIKKLTEDGDLITIAGGGRGNTTTYGIAVGLNTRQRQQLNSDLQNTVTRDSDHQKTVISGDENSVLPCQETVYSGDEANMPVGASASQKPTNNAQYNRHVDPSLDPSIGVSEDQDSTARTHPAIALLLEVFPKAEVSAEQTDDICSTVTDLVQWQELLRTWRTNGYKPRPGNMLDRYRKEYTNGAHQSRGTHASGSRMVRGQPRAIPADRAAEYKRQITEWEQPDD